MFLKRPICGGRVRCRVWISPSYRYDCLDKKKQWALTAVLLNRTASGYPYGIAHCQYRIRFKTCMSAGCYSACTNQKRKSVEVAVTDIFRRAAHGMTSTFAHAGFPKVLIRALGFPVRRAEVPLIVHRANPDSDGQVNLATFRLISESTSCCGAFFSKILKIKKRRKLYRILELHQLCYKVSIVPE